MNIILNNNSSEPIYLQIYLQIKAQILNGTLKAGDSLPSIRALAKSLKVSVITIKRAYQDLSNEQFIETTVGKGTFVKAINLKKQKEKALTEINELFTKTIKIAHDHSISKDVLDQIFNSLWKKEEHSE